MNQVQTTKYTKEKRTSESIKFFEKIMNFIEISIFNIYKNNIRRYSINVYKRLTSSL